MANPQVLNPQDTSLEEGVGQVIRDSGGKHQIEVMAKDGYVRLMGSVDCLEVKRKIESLVEAVPGVQIVTNHIRVVAWEEKKGPSHF